MKQYLSLINKIMAEGTDRTDRTGTGTRSIFGHQMRFDLQEGFPLLTTKKMHIRSIIYELLWFLQGNTNVKYLQDNKVRIWNEWADENGDLGPVYGAQWRAWEDKNGNLHDQISDVIQSIKDNPDSRRHIVSAWNVGELGNMALPPCHLLYQFYVEGNNLSCQLYQRSADVFLGVPFNIASYALLTELIAAQTGLRAKEFIWVGGDCHIYANHFEQVKVQYEREPYKSPKLLIYRNKRNIEDYVYEDFKVFNYNPWPAIKAPISI